MDGHLEDKPADGRDDRKSPPELPTDISQEMKGKTEELAVLHLTHPPEKIWWMVKNWADKEYIIRKELVWSTGGSSEKSCEKSSRTKLGFGNSEPIQNCEAIQHCESFQEVEDCGC